MTIAQRFAQIFGGVYVLVGIIGFIPPLVVGDTPAPLGVPALSGFLIGLFAINWLHSVAHLAIGAAGLASYRSEAAARTYALALGVVYLLLFVLGLIPGLNTVFGLLPLYGAADVLLHLLTALIAFGAYFASPEVPGPSAPRA
ncbi:MAG: DUF4383 domain-containing protein [Actinomycetota bacterium]|nr:DUF4383 domain-containing protein [Actinomycetota bacterium]